MTKLIKMVLQKGLHNRCLNIALSRQVFDDSSISLQRYIFNHLKCNLSKSIELFTYYMQTQAWPIAFENDHTVSHPESLYNLFSASEYLTIKFSEFSGLTEETGLTLILSFLSAIRFSIVSCLRACSSFLKIEN